MKFGVGDPAYFNMCFPVPFAHAPLICAVINGVVIGLAQKPHIQTAPFSQNRTISNGTAGGCLGLGAWQNAP